MYKLFMKEVKADSHPLFFVFIIFSFMFLIPGYPILCAPFFVTLGIFQSFQKARENGDIFFSVLLPIPKKDVVKGKFIFVIFLELCSAIIMAFCVVLRMTILRDNPVYLLNPMMRADFSALSLALLIFALFNYIFVRGFFLTAYNIGLPFLLYAVSAFTVVGGGEILSRLISLNSVNIRIALTAVLSFLCSLITFISYRMSVKSFLGLIFRSRNVQRKHYKAEKHT